MDAGWIKLHRKVIDSAVFSDDGLFKLWVLCLLLANHKDGWVKVDGVLQPIEVKRGQFITGRFALHKVFYPRRRRRNRSAKTIWEWLKMLQTMRNLDIKSCSKFSLVTIYNYSTYQDYDEQNVQVNVQQTCSSRAADVQLTCTNKNDKNVKNEKKKRAHAAMPPSLEEVTAYVGEQHLVMDPGKFHDNYTMNGWVQGKGKPILDWKAAARNWARNEPLFQGMKGTGYGKSNQNGGIGRIRSGDYGVPNITVCEDAPESVSDSADEARPLLPAEPEAGG